MYVCVRASVRVCVCVRARARARARAYMCVSVCERERETDRQTDRDRDRDYQFVCLSICPLVSPSVISCIVNFVCLLPCFNCNRDEVNVFMYPTYVHHVITTTKEREDHLH